MKNKKIIKEQQILKTWKFYFNFLKERDWLEEMARQGWLLTNIKLGMIYYFKKAAPCEKVFEIERFAVSVQPTIQELNARKYAIDIATQSGWEIVTHDEEMNYYFCKDKAGDETDEFYDDEASRKERAERFRNRYSYEIPMYSLKSDLFIALIDIVILAFLSFVPEIQPYFMWLFIIIMLLDLAYAFSCLVLGKYLYRDFCLSREEWENRKKYSVKKRFKKVYQLHAFLQEQNETGLSLIGYEDKKYLFEKDSCRYNYFIDTKPCLMKRLKEQGIPFENNLKDMFAQDPKWYEMSIAEAAQYSLKPVAVIKRNILIYKRPCSDKAFPDENGNATLSGGQAISLIGGIIGGILIIVGFILGYGLASIVF